MCAHIREWMRWRHYQYLIKLRTEFCTYNCYEDRYEWHLLSKPFSRRWGYTMFRLGLIDGWRK